MIGAPMAFSPNGLPIFKKGTFSPACKKDRMVEPEQPEPQQPTQYWRWKKHDEYCVGYGTLAEFAPGFRTCLIGDQTIDRLGNYSTYPTYIPFNDWESYDAFIDSFQAFNVGLAQPNYLPRRLSDGQTETFMTNTEYVITLYCGIRTGYNPFPSWHVIHSSSASTVGKDYLVVYVSGFWMNGAHPTYISGWASFVREYLN